MKPADYNSLKSKGLLLTEVDFSQIINSLIAGSHEAKKYLNVENESWPKFNFSNDISALGYSAEHDAICLSINYLNQLAGNLIPLQYKDQLVLFMPDTFYIIIKYLFWLKLLGRESTIHRYQKKEHQLLKARFPKDQSPSQTSKLMLLSDIEVEARDVSDKIALVHNEIYLWKNVDTYFSQNYPEHYNKSIEELIALPRPNFEATTEMEYYLI